MKEHQILFNGEMVRAILDGRKTQTRRVMRNDPVFLEYNSSWAYAASKCPFGKIGDRLWVRENWAVQHCFDGIAPRIIPLAADEWQKEIHIHYAAEKILGGLLGRPSIHMPRWASRITLEVTDMRVHRLQEISAHDSLAEGITHHTMNDPRVEFQWLWNTINAPSAHGWNTNPWVWAVSFNVI